MTLRIGATLPSHFAAQILLDDDLPQELDEELRWHANVSTSFPETAHDKYKQLVVEARRLLLQMPIQEVRDRFFEGMSQKEQALFRTYRKDKETYSEKRDRIDQESHSIPTDFAKSNYVNYAQQALLGGKDALNTVKDAIVEPVQFVHDMALLAASRDPKGTPQVRFMGGAIIGDYQAMVANNPNATDQAAERMEERTVAWANRASGISQLVLDAMVLSHQGQMVFPNKESEEVHCAMHKGALQRVEAMAKKAQQVGAQWRDLPGPEKLRAGVHMSAAILLTKKVPLIGDNPSTSGRGTVLHVEKKIYGSQPSLSTFTNSEATKKGHEVFAKRVKNSRARELIEEALSDIHPKHAEALRKRHGLDGGNSQVYAEVAEQMGVTVPRAQQMTRVAVRKLLRPSSDSKQKLRMALDYIEDLKKLAGQ